MSFLSINRLEVPASAASVGVVINGDPVSSVDIKTAPSGGLLCPETYAVKGRKPKSQVVVKVDQVGVIASLVFIHNGLGCAHCGNDQNKRSRWDGVLADNKSLAFLVHSEYCDIEKFCLRIPRVVWNVVEKVRQYWHLCPTTFFKLYLLNCWLCRLSQPKRKNFFEFQNLGGLV